MLIDNPEPTEPEFADYAYYGKVIFAGLERPSRDVYEPRVSTLAGDTTRILSEKNTDSAHDEHLHIGCYITCLDCSANTANSDGMDAMSTGPHVLPEQAKTIVLVKVGHRTHTTTEEAVRTRLGFLPLTKGGQASTNTDRVFAELPHERFCRAPYRGLGITGCVAPSVRGPNAEGHPTCPPTKHKVEHLSPKLPPVDPQGRTPKQTRQQPTCARQRGQQQSQHGIPEELSPQTIPNHPRRSDCVSRRANSCSPTSNLMRHRVLRRWREWELIGASGQS
jgi:hypothetical protein